MVQQNTAQSGDSTAGDSADAWGWVSIALHWTTAFLIVSLWLLGKSIATTAGAETDARRALHVSIAASAWLLLLARIAWRVRAGHPRVRGQGLLVHRVARTTHYVLLAAVGAMLLTGPLIVWANGGTLQLFAFAAIPPPFAPSTPVADFARQVHGATSSLVVWLVLLHVAGALKHLMFHSDETFVRMLYPPRRRLPVPKQ